MIINYLHSLICRKICIFTTDYQAVIMNTKILAEVFSETDLTYIQQLDERQYRLYCATRAISIGKHGVAAVCASIHISKNTIYRGIRELNGKTILSSETVRIAGGGRKERLTNHMYPKDKSESDLINNCLSGTMSLGANLLSIFVPSYFLTVTKTKKSEKVSQ